MITHASLIAEFICFPYILCSASLITQTSIVFLYRKMFCVSNAESRTKITSVQSIARNDLLRRNYCRFLASPNRETYRNGVLHKPLNARQDHLDRDPFFASATMVTGWIQNDVCNKRCLIIYDEVLEQRATVRKKRHPTGHRVFFYDTSRESYPFSGIYVYIFIYTYCRIYV